MFDICDIFSQENVEKGISIEEGRNEEYRVFIGNWDSCQPVKTHVDDISDIDDIKWQLPVNYRVLADFVKNWIKSYGLDDIFKIEAYDEDADYFDDVDIYDNVFKIENWSHLSYDKSRKAFKTIKKKIFEEAKEKHFSRRKYEPEIKNPVEEFKYIMAYFAEIPYVYEGDGYDNFNKYQRPCSNEIGYVAICPSASYHNFYTDNVYAVKALKRKFIAWKEAHPDVGQIQNVDLRERLAARKRK